MKANHPENVDDNAVAIVAADCFFPGGVDSLDKYWDVLADGIDLITEIPSTRWTREDCYDPVPGKPQKTYSHHGGFIHDVDKFDAGFFGISKREARTLDPQQRLLLELGYRTLDAAKRPSEGTIGVFVGSTGLDYEKLLYRDEHRIDGFTGTGISPSFIAGRLAHCLGLSGPTLVVDTACSSSLVALNLAHQSIISGESDMALVAASNLVLSPETSIYLSQVRALSPDGRCRAFDESANGYVRSEGAAAVVLKPLVRARSDRDNILGVIRGIAVNHDGNGSGLTEPNAAAQVRVIKQALRYADLAPTSIGYVEAHGTGTPVGDPVELEALDQAYGEGRKSPLLVGSVKSNIGHLEATSGLAGLLKVLMMFKHKTIPQTLHYHSGNKKFQWNEGALEVVASLTNVEGMDERFVAGVSSFGLSGTNAHVLLSPAPSSTLIGQEKAVNSPQYLLVVSAKDPNGLSRSLETIRTALGQSDIPLGGLCFTQSRKHQLNHRWYATGQSRDELLALLEAELERAAVSVDVRKKDARTIAYLFTGQGSQYVGMGLDLYQRVPRFCRYLDEVITEIEKFSDFNVLQVMLSEGGDINKTSCQQPIIFAFQVALGRLWQDLGVDAEVLVGHSLGEYAVAYFGGIFSLTDAAKLVCARGRLMEALALEGRMIAVMASRQQLDQAMEGVADVWITAFNARNNFTVGGSPNAVSTVAKRLRAIDVTVVELPLTKAFHTPLMQPVLEAFAAVLHTVTFNQPTKTLINNIDGCVSGASGCDMSQPDYWLQQIVSPVSFARCMQTLAQDSSVLAIEVGPKPVLKSFTSEHLNLRVLASASPRNTQRVFLEAVGSCFLQGVDIDQTHLYEAISVDSSALIPYPFERQSYWMDDRFQSSQPGANLIELSVTSDACLGDHLLEGTILVPGMYLLGLLLAELKQRHIDKIVSDVEFTKALAFDADDKRFVRFDISGNRATISDESGALYLTCHLRDKNQDSYVADVVSPTTLEGIDSLPYSKYGEEIFDGIEALSIWLGPSFRWPVELHWSDTEAFCKIDPNRSMDHRFPLPPGLLDGSVQLASSVVQDYFSSRAPFVPVALQQITQINLTSRPMAAHWQVEQCADTKDELVGHVTCLGERNEVLFQLLGLRLKQIDKYFLNPNLHRRTGSPADVLGHISWQPRDIEQRLPESDAPVILLADDYGIANQIYFELEEKGVQTLLVSLGKETRKMADAEWTLDADQPQQIHKIFEQAKPLLVSKSYRMIYCWSLAEKTGYRKSTNLPADQIFSESHRNGWLLVSAMQAALTKLKGLAALSIVFNGNMSNPESSDLRLLSQSVVCGLGRSFMREYPRVRVRMIDLGEDFDNRERNVLAEQAFDDILYGREDHVSYTRGQRQIGKLTLIKSDAPMGLSAGSLSADKVYLVVGAGDLGLKSVEWLVNRGARRIVSLSRSGGFGEISRVVPPGVREQIEAHGYPVDVTNAANVNAVLNLIREKHGAIGGLLYTAGLSGGGVVPSLTEDMLTHTFLPKVFGALNFHNATLGDNLDFFTLYSSISAVIGSPGQSDYAAANHFLDDLAAYRRSLGLPALSIAWGPWDKYGMAKRISDRRQSELKRSGLRFMHPDASEQFLDMALTYPGSQVIPMYVNWDKYISSSESDEYSYIWLDDADIKAGTNTELPMSSSRFDAYDKEDIPHFIVYVLRGILELSADQKIDENQSFAEIGLTSLTGMELMNELELAYNVRLEPADMYEYTTVRALANYLKSIVTVEASISENVVTKEEDIQGIENLLEREIQLIEELMEQSN